MTDRIIYQDHSFELIYKESLQDLQPQDYNGVGKLVAYFLDNVLDYETKSLLFCKEVREPLQ